MSLKDSRMVKTKIYSRPHEMDHAWFHGLEPAVTNGATIYPLCLYDEGLGTPSDYEAHRENAAFVSVGMPNCFPESRVDFIISRLTLSLTKAAITTDAIPAVNVQFMPIFTSFIEDYTAIDELSTMEIQDVLELTTESTDNQGFPLYNDVKVIEKFANSALLDAAMPGLTSTQVLEGVAWQPGLYYDMLHFQTNSNKLKVCQGGLKSVTLTPNKPVASFKIRLRNKTKRMNKFTFFGILVSVPGVGSRNQYAVAADTANLNHVAVNMVTRYNEWNPEFNMKKV